MGGLGKGGHEEPQREEREGGEEEVEDGQGAGEGHRGPEPQAPHQDEKRKLKDAHRDVAQGEPGEVVGDPQRGHPVPAEDLEVPGEEDRPRDAEQPSDEERHEDDPGQEVVHVGHWGPGPAHPLRLDREGVLGR